ncbi:DUF2326 domain-containing protein [Paenilisteria newyorkensis]|uniref:DUF2326 domain-containing protein n=1 Tax=Listeria newyorkensis TaxID=1497681 RepID=UPI000669CEB9|nr:DUF2326 domain-containing protein [Listeria newyorkensis]KMT61247.1 hypothetical protein X559_2213 [Listeria newyorkensis]
MIYELDCDFPGFKKINFKPGVNIILAEKKINSTNSVGKTLMLECINFIFGATYADCQLTKYKELEGHTVKLKMDLINKKVEVSRIISDSNKSKVLLDGKLISLKTWKTRLLEHYFSRGDDSNILTWRSLMHFFFITESNNDFQKALKSFGADPTYKTDVYQSFLLNIATDEFEKLAETKKITSQKTGFTRYINTLNKSADIIPELKTAPLDEYEKVNDMITKKINSLKIDIQNTTREKNIINSKIGQLENNLSSIEPTSSEELNVLFGTLESELGLFVKKTFEEANAFHKSLIDENREVIRNEIESLSEERSRIEQFLKSEKYELKKLLDGKLDTEAISTKSLQRIFTNNFLFQEGANIAKEINENVKSIENTLPNEIQKILSKKQKIIKKYKEFLERQVYYIYKKDREVSFNIEYDSGLKIDFSYIDDSGNGKGNMKSLIYYMSVLLFNRVKLSRGIDFLVLDTDATDGIDSSNLESLFELANQNFKGENIQLIATLRNDRNIRLHESEDDNWIASKLSDSPDGFLFKADLQKRK